MLVRDDETPAPSNLTEGAAEMADASAPVTRLAVRGLSKAYGSRPAVIDVSFDVGNGVTALLGPNGAGKSTILKSITGIQDWDAGEIVVDGVDARTDPRRVRTLVGYMPERAAFPSDIRVEAYLAHVARMKGVPRSARADEVSLAMDRLDLGPVSGRVVNNLSKGYRQRVGLAQAIIGDPPVLVLDEPLAGIDPLHVWDFRDVLWEYGRDHAIVLSTHMIPEARVLCESILVISAGSLVFDGSLVSAELTGSVTRRWRLGVSGPALPMLEGVLAGYGLEIVHAASNGPSNNLVVDAESPDLMHGLVRRILDEGWRLAHFEPMTDLIGAAFEEAGLIATPLRGPDDLAESDEPS